MPAALMLPTGLPQQLGPAIDKPIPHPTPVDDVADRARPLELAAQAARVRVERPRCRIRLVAPHVAQQLALCEDTQRVRSQLAQQPELEP